MSLLDRSKLEDLIATALKRLMKEYGFLKEEDTILYKHRKQFYDFFSSSGLIVNSGKFYKLELIQKRIHPVETVWEDLMASVNIDNMINTPSITISARYCYPELVNQSYFDLNFNGIKSEATVQGVEQYMSLFKPILTDYLLPAVEKYNDIREINKTGMESMALTRPVQGFLGTQGANFRRLIIAKLAGDKNFEALYDYEMSFEAEYLKADRFKNYPGVFREIYKRLQNVPPLENPILD